MIRIVWACLCGTVLAVPSTASAAAEPLSGNWKLSVSVPGQNQTLQTLTLWLIKLQSRDGKWTGDVLASDEERVGKATLVDLKVGPELLRFMLKGQQLSVPFEGKLPGTAKTILGSVVLGSQTFPAQLEQTTLTSLDSYDLAKDALAKETGPKAVNSALVLLSHASEKKAKPEDVRSWGEKAFKNAEPYGPRYQLEIALRVARVLTQQEEFAKIAVQFARRAERLLEPASQPVVHKRVLEVLAEALTKAGQTEEAKEVEARNNKIPWIKVTPFAGRQAKSDRAVLVELFTGAQCPPCVAADLAFDALTRTYKPSEVVPLEYHLHIPGPDPLTNAYSEARQQYYGNSVQGTPTILFDGKALDSGGGPFEGGQDKYAEYSGSIDALLNEPAQAQLQVSAVRKGDKINITAEASGVAKPGDNVRLRLALVEREVDYKGGNRIPSYHHVVRDLPGGAAGLALKEKTGKQTVTVDVSELRKNLEKYLDEFAKETPFPSTQRPLELRNLLVVAFVQDDATRKVLQATQADVQSVEGAK